MLSIISYFYAYYYCSCVHATICLRTSEDDFVESVYSFYLYVGFRIELRSLGLHLHVNHPYQLSYLAHP